MIILPLFHIAFLTIFLTAISSYAETLDEVRGKGVFRCGVSQGLPGFSFIEANGQWSGLDVEYCRAMSAALFDDPGFVDFVPLSNKERFDALRTGKVDILVRNTTWTMGRDTQLGINFTGVNYYDGQGFMVPKSLNVQSAVELAGALLCSAAGTTTELNAADFFRGLSLPYEIVSLEEMDDVIDAYDAGRCDIYTTDSSALYGQKLKLSYPEDHVILPEIISKEPLGPAVREGDDTWFNFVKWVHFAMLNAEEMGISSRNIDQMISSGNPAIRRFLGLEGSFGEDLGLTNDWALRIVRHVGNYAESFNRNVGPDTELGIERGLNALWRDGGLQYAPPIR